MSGFGFALAIIHNPLCGLFCVSTFPKAVSFFMAFSAFPPPGSSLHRAVLSSFFYMQETITKPSKSSNNSNGSPLNSEAALKQVLLDFKIAWVHLCLLSSFQLTEARYLLLHSSIFAFSLLQFSGSWISTHF